MATLSANPGRLSSNEGSPSANCLTYSVARTRQNYHLKEMFICKINYWRSVVLLFGICKTDCSLSRVRVSKFMLLVIESFGFPQLFQKKIKSEINETS